MYEPISILNAPPPSEPFRNKLRMENKNLLYILRKKKNVYETNDRKPKLTTYSLHLVQFMSAAPTIGRQFILNRLTEM